MSDWTDFPVCPYCQCVDQDWWDGLPPKFDSDSWEVDCSNCDQYYTVTLCVEHSFQTSKELEDGCNIS